MSESDIRLQVCPVELFDTLLDSMGQLVSACVEGGASINFVLPFSAQDAQQWWSIQRESIEKGSAVLMLALAEDGKRVAGSVIMAPAWQPNGPHRAEVKKMLVHPDFQRRGLGRALLQLLEHEALKRQLWLLYLDTETGSSGERLYTAQGYIAIGQIPQFALNNDGRTYIPATFMYKLLQKPESE